MFFIAKIYFIAFGLVSILGGAIGYFKAGSVASIIAGSISGILLLAAGLLIPVYWKPGLILGLVISLALAGRFIPALLKGYTNPALYMAPLAVVGIILAVAAWVKGSPNLIP